MSDTPGKDLWQSKTEAFLSRPGITRSTMMGFPCLRVEGQFFASVHKEGTHLVVKLPKERVKKYIEEGAGETFAPNGRTFKEWIAVPVAQSDAWDAYIEEALVFVGG